MATVLTVVAGTVWLVPFVRTISQNWQLTSLIIDESTEARGGYPTIHLVQTPFY